MLCKDIIFKMYFNWVGSVKVPAPVYYANKLNTLVSDKFDSNFSINQHLEKKQSLYFI